MKLKKYIPNAFTLLNLSAGLLAIIAIFKGYYDQAFSFVFLGIFFDFFDGFFARKFNVSGALGVQLDSLADMVTCGVVPGLMLFKLFQDIQEDYYSPYFLTEEYFYMGFVPYLGFIVTLASCYRLAKFNIDTRQTEHFIGLPTPANALLILSLPMIQYTTDEEEWLHQILYNPFVLLGIIIISSLLLNANISLFSLKIKGFSFEKYKLQILFILSSIILFLYLDFIAIPVIIFSYIILSLLFFKNQEN